jgi:hypothetical protein
METEIMERTRGSTRPVLMNATDPSTQCLRFRRGEENQGQAFDDAVQKEIHEGDRMLAKNVTKDRASIPLAL